MAPAIHELNLKTVNGIYLETFAAGIEPDAQQITVLEEIGSLCPLLGGDAVHEARALYSLIGQASYNDSLEHGQDGRAGGGGVFLSGMGNLPRLLGGRGAAGRREGGEGE